ncbi:TonB-dependent receptor [Oxalobacteraceae bacterium CAVE-383]|nr:TonB-dependent receptor [Oxalobacteraceae bacterium CAVE-383]
MNNSAWGNRQKKVFRPVRLGHLTILTVSAMAMAQSANANAPNFADMSIEELANVQITSVSKKRESLADAPASIYVITNDDIRRSGATTLPEALRLAPNLQVAQASASGYGISARGQSGSSNGAPNKLLVLIDGRSVYTPLFSGVFWDVQDVMLEDVDRIEVISGPGGTLWGSNAVNGVINVITRSSKDTQGTLVAGSAGNHGGEGAFRQGGELGNGGAFRVYGKYSDHDDTKTASGSAVTDGWHKTQAGFRADWDGAQGKVAVMGNIYDANIGQPAPGAVNITGLTPTLGAISASGANLTADWTHRLEGGSSVNVQAYYDRTTRNVPPFFDETLDIVDLQLQHTLKPWGMHSVVWGGGFRHARDNVANGAIISFLPALANQNWTNIFAQDEMALRDDLRLIVGARVERNPYTGNEFLPNARLAWTPATGHLLWTAASRTVRAPSRLDVDLFFPSSGPPFILRGGPQVVSEVAKVYEIGYRGTISPKFSWSVTAFHNIYDNLQTQETDPSLTFVTLGSTMEGKATGVETWGSYQLTQDWRLSAGLTMLDEVLRLKPGSLAAANSPDISGRNPQHTWSLRSSWNVTPSCEFDLAVRRVAALTSPDVPAYTAVDARLGWKLRPDLQLAVVGQNLFGTQHGEFNPVATRSEIPTTVAVTLLWKF